MYPDEELDHGWDAESEFHPMFRLWLVAPESWKPTIVFDYTEYWHRQATLGESAGLGDDPTERGWGL